MSQKAYVRATKPALIAGLIVIAAFLIFGIVFMCILIEEDATIGVVFMAFWIFVVLLMGGIQIHNLRHYQEVERNVAEEIVIPDFPEKAGAQAAFAEKIRGLESLKKEGLISEDEYRRKRAEIMDQKW